jgi:hypothetical protein
MTLSLRLWDALQRPPLQHPLFRRTMRHFQPRYEPITPRLPTRLGWLLLTVISVVIATVVPQAIALVLLFAPLIFGAAYAFLFATVIGAALATRISAMIARERERGLLDLIAVTPRGGFEGIWAICTGCQYYDQSLRGRSLDSAWSARIMVLVLLFIYAALSYSELRTRVDVETFAVIVVMLLIGGFAFHIDDVHSLVIANLVGLLVPLITLSRFNARLWALLGFLTLQTFAYLLTWALGFGIAPLLFGGLRLYWMTERVALAGTQLLVFFALRELMTRALWIALLLLQGRADPVSAPVGRI